MDRETFISSYDLMHRAEPTAKPTAQREALVSLVLAAIAIAAFAAVLGLTTRFHSWQASLAERMYGRGEHDLEAGRAARAVEDFRSALAFDRDNSVYQFRLAQALEAEGQLDQAESYLINLWERQPQNGRVNMQLARLAVRRDARNQALRYYHNAIYGIWDSQPDENRRAARLELVEFLCQTNARAQVQSELIAMQAGLPPDPQLHLKVANLFLKIDDYENALAQFRQVLQLDHGNLEAEAGAGEAAFELGRYRTGVRYLESAVAANPKEEELRKKLEIGNLILESNPFRPSLSIEERRRRVQNAFRAASARLKHCRQTRGQSIGDGAADSFMEKLNNQQTRLRAKLRPRALDDPDFQESVMDFVFEVEEQTTGCGSPTGLDQALVLIGRNREGAER
jgi:tetratricopeptide (TPR) repeat protein